MIISTSTVYKDIQSFPPFTSLPSELLIEIFSTCSLTGDWHIPLTLSKVCRLWRDLIVSAPCIWQTIVVLESRRTMSSIRTQAELWVARSSPLPFNVVLKLTDFERLLPIMSCFLPNIARWMRCTITYDGRNFETSLSDLTLSSPRRILHHLDILLKTPFEDVAGDDEDDVIFFSCGSATYRHISMRVATTKLPHTEMVNPLLFTSLDISEAAFEYSVRSPDLLRFLAHCPNLEHLYFHGLSNDEGTLNAPLPSIALPRLHTLLLDQVCNQRSILSHLHLPALRELHLRHINVDYSLEPYYVSEEGDSDDEFHDFSQSPHSDLHTGMGIRKLLSRSHPPLEILDMDLSDMRTKDFRWVFDKLSDLKQFSIVGSDMSDSVVALFMPFVVEDGDGERMSVRLPRLSVLKMYSCQQLSGDALVKALSARVHYTDHATPDATLTTVVISSCNDFTAGNAQELSWDLHDRLHVS
ncbi:uncharacterized protein F5891DRAFT_955973 [Suillus fuscotomentosus]|uniref:F-box domain-containing protein n=1 Tax=Suillus fuscotomentosus TaxID=1912939 RepID=A0AAD4HJ69_9AGAM|nr:uncharacterized protein F5891DRAFT_955973 [Suillus fuscotomentosus]KAG1898136.1 hypothetical protein F5891DRAFT_955973 [Suillus fuscotomentosus]